MATALQHMATWHFSVRSFQWRSCNSYFHLIRWNHHELPNGHSHNLGFEKGDDMMICKHLIVLKHDYSMTTTYAISSNDYWIMFDLWFTVYRKPASANILLHIHIRQIHTEMFQHGDPKICLTRQNGKFWHAIHQTAGIKTPSKFRSFCICQVPNSARLTSCPIEPTRQGLKSVVFENITCKASSPEESSGRFWLGEQVKEWWTHDDLLNIDIIE